jgi:hypothetical protein
MNWFLLAALFVVMYLFNGNVAASQTTKTAVNIVAIVATIVLAVLTATGHI